jgi:hypothetical protein
LNLESLCESVSRQLGAWIESLKDSDYQGSRFQNVTTRKAAHGRQRREAFMDKPRQIQEEARRLETDSDPTAKDEAPAF